MGLEAIEPVHQLEPAGQIHQRPELLWEHHPRVVPLTVDSASAVLVDLQLHVLGDDLGDWIDVLERLEGGPDGGLAAAAGPGPASRRLGPRRAHVAVEDVEPDGLERPSYAPEVGEDR